MIRVVGQREVARQIDFDPVPLADRDGRKNVQESVEYLRRRLRRALRESLAHEVGTGSGEGPGGSAFGDRADRADGERDAEDAEVVVVDLVAQTGVADLVEPLKMVEACGKSVGHYHAMEGDGETGLAEGLDLAGLAKQFGPGWNQKMLPVVGVNIARQKAFDGSSELAVEPVDENGFEYGSFKKNVGFARGRSRCARRRGNRARVSSFFVSSAEVFGVAAPPAGKLRRLPGF